MWPNSRPEMQWGARWLPYRHVHHHGSKSAFAKHFNFLIVLELDLRLRLELAVAAKNAFVPDERLGVPQLQHGAQREEVVVLADFHHAVVERKSGRLQAKFFGQPDSLNREPSQHTRLFVDENAPAIAGQLTPSAVMLARYSRPAHAFRRNAGRSSIWPWTPRHRIPGRARPWPWRVPPICRMRRHPGRTNHAASNRIRCGNEYPGCRLGRCRPLRH